MSCCGKINKTKNIIKGITNMVVGYTTEMSENRLNICINNCDNKQKIASFAGKNIYICKLCGCLIEAKVTIENEKCKLNKW